MKKTIIAIVLLFSCILAGGQGKTDNKNYKREGNTFVQTDSSSQPTSADIATAYTWRDSKGNEYPIYLHTYTKGEKAGRVTAYVIRTSAKSGKQYKQYLGEEIAKEILKDSGTL